MICNVAQQTGDLNNTGHIINKLSASTSSGISLVNNTNISVHSTGLYMISANIILDKGFNSINNELAIFRYKNDGSNQTLLTASKFYVGTCIHASHMNILSWIDAEAYIQIHAIGCVTGGWISIFRVF